MPSVGPGRGGKPLTGVDGPMDGWILREAGIAWTDVERLTGDTEGWRKIVREIRECKEASGTGKSGEMNNLLYKNGSKSVKAGSSERIMK